MRQLIVIPARIGSTRLPRKPLLDLKGKPTIQHVYEAAINTGIDTIVATDNEEIATIVRSFGGTSIITDTNLMCGTDRVAQAVALFDPHEQYSEIVNLQGDMPFVSTAHILDALKPLQKYDMGTVVFDMEPEDYLNKNSVKAVVSWDNGPNGLGRAHWFARAALGYGYHHAGIYSFKRRILKRFYNSPHGVYEGFEQLEQLRAIEQGITIGVKKTLPVSGEINTQEDLDRANA